MSSHTASHPLLTLGNRAEATTLLDLARWQYESRPDATAVTLITAGSDEPRSVTVREFFDGAGRYAEALRGADLAPRDLVILVMDHGEALLYAFWGAMMLGTVPSIFPFLSDKLDPVMYYERVKALVEHSGAKAVVASEGFAEPLTALLDGINVIHEAQLKTGSVKARFDPVVGAGAIAFFQHSSVTTVLHKVVALSHRALLYQLATSRHSL